MRGRSSKKICLTCAVCTPNLRKFVRCQFAAKKLGQKYYIFQQEHTPCQLKLALLWGAPLIFRR
jgi:hypothetical protein